MSVTLSPAAQRRLSLAVIIANTAVAAMAFGFVVPVFAFQLDARGHSSTTVGLFAAIGSVAVVLGASLVPRVIARLGTAPALYLAFAAIIGPMLLFPATESIALWFLFRFLLGLGVAVQWITAETWLNRLAPPEQRGRLIAIYVTTLALSFAAGPALVGFVGTAGALPFFAAAGIAGTAVVLLLFARCLVPELPVEGRAGVLANLRANPLLMVTALVGGMNDMSMIALSPLYGLRVGYGEDVSVLLLTVYMAGTVALQWPLGWLADRTNRIAILCLCLSAGVAGGILLPLLHGTVFVWPLLFLWGGLSFGLYTVSLTELASRMPLAALAGANAAFVMAYESGSVSGPTISGAAMDWLGPQGLPMALLAIDGACLVLVLCAGFRRKRA